MAKIIQGKTQEMATKKKPSEMAKSRKKKRENGKKRPRN